jgi:hypothetical protein
MIYKGPSFLAVVCFGSMPTPSSPLPSASCLSFSVFLCVAVQLTDGGGKGWALSRIIRPPQESLAIYKSLNTLWSK